ncbi:MAG: hypothetical protein KDH94_02725, partial [Coxiellaceae bacterium]|nr:hypothetical protein [Coxiellaceae bacterium]
APITTNQTLCFVPTSPCILIVTSDIDLNAIAAAQQHCIEQIRQDEHQMMNQWRFSLYDNNIILTNTLSEMQRTILSTTCDTQLPFRAMQTHTEHSLTLSDSYIMFENCGFTVDVEQHFLAVLASITSHYQQQATPDDSKIISVMTAACAGMQGFTLCERVSRMIKQNEKDSPLLQLYKKNMVSATKFFLTMMHLNANKKPSSDEKKQLQVFDAMGDDLRKTFEPAMNEYFNPLMQFAMTLPEPPFPLSREECDALANRVLQLDQCYHHLTQLTQFTAQDRKSQSNTGIKILFDCLYRLLPTTCTQLTTRTLYWHATRLATLSIQLFSAILPYLDAARKERAAYTMANLNSCIANALVLSGRIREAETAMKQCEIILRKDKNMSDDVRLMLRCNIDSYRAKIYVFDNKTEDAVQLMKAIITNISKEYKKIKSKQMFRHNARDIGVFIQQMYASMAECYLFIGMLHNLHGNHTRAMQCFTNAIAIFTSDFLAKVISEINSMHEEKLHIGSITQAHISKALISMAERHIADIRLLNYLNASELLQQLPLCEHHVTTEHDDHHQTIRLTMPEQRAKKLTLALSNALIYFETPEDNVKSKATIKFSNQSFDDLTPIKSVLERFFLAEVAPTLNQTTHYDHSHDSTVVQCKFLLLKGITTNRKNIIYNVTLIAAQYFESTTSNMSKLD